MSKLQLLRMKTGFKGENCINLMFIYNFTFGWKHHQKAVNIFKEQVRQEGQEGQRTRPYQQTLAFEFSGGNSDFLSKMLDSNGVSQSILGMFRLPKSSNNYFKELTFQITLFNDLLSRKQKLLCYFKETFNQCYYIDIRVIIS